MAQEPLVAKFKIQARTLKDTTDPSKGPRLSFKGEDGKWYAATKPRCTDEAWDEMTSYVQGDLIQFPYTVSQDGVWPICRQANQD